MEIGLVRHPHPRQPGKMINLVDVAQAATHQIPIEHRPCHVVDFGQGSPRTAKIENSHLAAACHERRYEVLSDEAAAPGDKYPGHECGGELPCGWSGKAETPPSARSRTGPMMMERSRLKPSAMNNFAVTNIGPSSK